ncbi:G-protein coupled receptor 52-like [Portunus trituberculatus]|uniref:G-protein coupled receptor 52-like n=1 Tax=Portunus trituberculatus TaxID=210409 RepID=UPI001E1CBB18|nr:G-protein coupled receptor 52-like [Portunus trituberculatus]
MNSSVSASPTTAGDEVCLDDCYLLKLMGERSHTATIVSRLPLSFILVVFSGITVVVTRRTARLMERPSTTLVTNLGVTGALIGGILFVTTVLHLVMTMSFRAVVIMGIILPRTLHIAISLTLTCLTLDRFLALCRPLRYYALLTDSRCCVLVVLSWLIPTIVLGVACIYGRTFKPCTDIRPFLVIYLVMFISTIAAMVVMNFLIAREFRRPLDDGSAFREELVIVRRRTAKELMVVVLLNLLFATPDVMMQIYLLNCPETLSELYYVVPLLLLVHLLCFFPLYAWKNLDFRKGMLDTFTSYRTSLTRLLGRICHVSVTEWSFVRVSFTRLSRTSTSTASSGVLSAPSAATTVTTTAALTVTTTTTATAALSTSTSTSSLPSVVIVTPSEEHNTVFFA